MSLTSPNRRPARLWQTTTFRLAMIFAAVFGLGTAVLLLVLDLAIGGYAEQTGHDALRDQVAILKADANAEGGSALIGALREHVSSGQPERFSYLVVTPTGERLSAGLPDSVQAIQGLASIELPIDAGQVRADWTTIEIVVLTDRARDGTFIAVGRDTYAQVELRSWLHRLALFGGAGLVGLSLVAGALAGAMLLRRLKRVTEAAGRVMGGDLGARLPSMGIGREFDDLADTLNAMLDRLEDAMEALRQVSSDVAHDLRTPLTRLRNRLEETQQASAGRRDALLADAIGETDNLLEVFAALLRLAQIEGGMERRLAPVRLDDIAAGVVDAYLPAAQQAGRALRLSARSDVVIEADATMMAQAVASLIDNALTHATSGRMIEVVVHPDGPDVLFGVLDDGPGAPDVDLPRLSRRFYRLDRSRRSEGSGLGLSLVNAIARLHGGRLEISNRQPGLSVLLRLPRDDQPARSAGPATSGSVTSKVILSSS